jgi:hypothetical protein
MPGAKFPDQIPLSTRPIPKQHYKVMVEAVARKLPPCHGSLMARSDRLVRIKLVLRAVPIYVMMAEKSTTLGKERN